MTFWIPVPLLSWILLYICIWYIAHRKCWKGKASAKTNLESDWTGVIASVRHIQSKPIGCLHRRCSQLVTTWCFVLVQGTAPGTCHSTCCGVVKRSACIHPFSSAYPKLGHGGSRLSGVFSACSSPAALPYSSRGTPRRSQASWDM